MKKVLLYLPVIIALFVFAACQKNVNATAGTDFLANKINTYTESVTTKSVTNSSVTYTYTYDAGGRITSIVSTTNPGDKYLYTYSLTNPNKYSLDLYNADTLSIHEDFYLNSSSLTDSTFQYNGTDSSTERYLYDGNLHLITYKEYDYSKVTGTKLANITTYTYDILGNVLKSTDLQGNIYTYSYLPSMYAYPITVAPNDVITGNILSTEVANLGGTIDTANYSYTYDFNNRVSTSTAVVSDSAIVTTTYTYY